MMFYCAELSQKRYPSDTVSAFISLCVRFATLIGWKVFNICVNVLILYGHTVIEYQTLCLRDGSTEHRKRARKDEWNFFHVYSILYTNAKKY